MHVRQELRKKIREVDTLNFNDVALEVFEYQYAYNSLYRQFCDLLNRTPRNISDISGIPFLPVSFFKSHTIKSGNFLEEAVFTSSGTSGNKTARHFVKDLSWYDDIALSLFESQYGDINEFRILALLPSYLERKGSSLIRMVQEFIKKAHSGGFYLNEFTDLIKELEKPFKGKTLLIGVSFALLDLAENHDLSPGDTIVMETGGMKGRRKELTRQELHKILGEGLGVDVIHSEYGMTELLSQAYSKGDGLFFPGRTMRVFTRELSDPLSMTRSGRVGGLNIIDLANVDSISFLAIEDVGRVYEDGSFEVLGRMDASDTRGCNLMYNF